MIILVDVDLTVVDSMKYWKEWYEKLTGHDISEEIKFRGDTSIEDIMANHHDPHEFWRKHDLYDEMEPIEESIDVLSELHNAGCQIVFASACFPEHENSKRMFLKRNFKFPYKFVSTSDKGAIRCDYAVDDYTKYLDKIQEGNPDAVMFHYKTSINEEGKYQYVDWFDIRKIIKRDLELLVQEVEV